MLLERANAGPNKLFSQHCLLCGSRTDKPHPPSRARPTCDAAVLFLSLRRVPCARDYPVNHCLVPDAGKLLPFRKEVLDLTNGLLYLFITPGQLFSITPKHLAQSMAHTGH